MTPPNALARGALVRLGLRLNYATIADNVLEAVVSLAAGIAAVDSVKSLWYRERPDRSAVGTVILALSVIVMPVLARAKRGVARELGSAALECC